MAGNETAGNDAAGDDTAGDVPVLLSAPTPRHLAAAGRQLAQWLEDTGRARTDLPALARSLRAHRGGHPCRAALIVRDVPHLLERLRDFPGEHDGAVDLRNGHGDPMGLNGLPETAGYLTALWRAGHVEQLVRLWLSGVEVDWAAIEGRDPRGPARAPLPPPPFLRRPLWLDDHRPRGRER